MWSAGVNKGAEDTQWWWGEETNGLNQKVTKSKRFSLVKKSHPHLLPTRQNCDSQHGDTGAACMGHTLCILNAR